MVCGDSQRCVDKYYSICYDNYMNSISSREVIKELLTDGWVEVRVSGSHHQFKKKKKKGTVTVKDPDKDIPKSTIKSIERQSGIKFLK